MMFVRFFDLPTPVDAAAVAKPAAVKAPLPPDPKPMVVAPTPIRIRPLAVAVQAPATKPEPVRYGASSIMVTAATKPKLSRKEREAELARKRADRLREQPPKGPSERVDTRKGLNPPSRERRQ